MTFTKTPEPHPPLLGLVLAGGRSTRMGVDKSTIDYHGKPQFEYLYDLLATYCEDVFLSINAEQARQLSGSRFNLIEDNSPVIGPLAGILTAFQYQSASRTSPTAWLVISCDLPLLSEKAIQKLLLNRKPDKIATAFWDSDHRFPDPSVCIWEPGAYSSMLRSIDEGTPYPRTILMNNDIELVEMEDVNELTNVNTPDVLTAIQQDTLFLREAIRLAKEGSNTGQGGPFGTVIVKDGQIVGRGYNQVTSTNDPTAHAEVVAIRDACQTLKTFQLTGCTLYTSCEPCPMCLGAIYWARPERIVYGCIDSDAARAGFDDHFIYQELAKPRENRSIPMHQHLHQEALLVFQEWMEKSDKIDY